MSTTRSTTKTPWHHCSRCGALFQSPTGSTERRTCPKCNSSDDFESTPAFAAKLPEYRVRIAKTVPKPTGLFSLPGKVMMSTLLAGVLIIGTRLAWLKSRPQPRVAPAKVPVTIPQPSLEEADRILRDQALMADARAPISNALSGVLSTRTPQQALQHIIATPDALTRLEEFYRETQAISISTGAIQLLGTTVLRIPSQRAVEVRWKVPGAGLTLDTAFMEEDGKWRLDFEHFAQLSSSAWPFFLIGTGDESQEFRLLARLRHSDESETSPHITVVLHSPTFGKPVEVSTKSPDFLIPRSGEIGRHFSAAFQADRAGKRPFGSVLPKLESEEFIRVRVRVRRTQTGDEKQFQITDLLACHWYSTDEAGLEIPKP